MRESDADGGKREGAERSDAVPRREFLKLGGGAGLAAGVGFSHAGHAQTRPPEPTSAKPPGQDAYPVVNVAPLAKIEVGKEIAFAYPDESSPAALIRLKGPAEGGIGPGQDIVAFSILCTHKGCPVSFKAARGVLLCACHWSSFDPAKAGRMIIGQASEPLPQIQLRLAGDMVQAFGVTGLIYGRHTNIK